MQALAVLKPSHYTFSITWAFSVCSCCFVWLVGVFSSPLLLCFSNSHQHYGAYSLCGPLQDLFLLVLFFLL